MFRKKTWAPLHTAMGFFLHGVLLLLMFLLCPGPAANKKLIQEKNVVKSVRCK